MFQIREHKFGSDPIVTQTCRYLDNAKATIHHYVMSHKVDRWSISILGPNGEIYTLKADFKTWEVSEKI